MSPVKQIGRYMLPILNVVAIEERRFPGWRKVLLRLGLFRRGYNVVLANGHVIHFTEQEKKAYDEAIEFHGQVLNVWGMCKSLGLRA